MTLNGLKLTPILPPLDMLIAHLGSINKYNYIYSLILSHTSLETKPTLLMAPLQERNAHMNPGHRFRKQELVS